MDLLLILEAPAARERFAAAAAAAAAGVQERTPYLQNNILIKPVTRLFDISESTQRSNIGKV